MTTTLTTVEKLEVGAAACARIACELPAQLAAFLDVFVGGIELQIAFPSKDTANESKNLAARFADAADAMGLGEQVAPVLPLLLNLVALSQVRAG